MNTQATLEQLKELKLNGMLQAYQAVLQLPVHQHPDGHQLVAQLLHAEQQSRMHYRMLHYLRNAHLRYPALIEEVEFNQERNLHKEQLFQLIDCAYIKRAENILITGATGCGKSFLACALGYQACQMGYRVKYLNINKFIEKITLAKLDGSFVKLLDSLAKVQLLILDDFGLTPLDQNSRLALLQVLEDRYGKYSVIVSSQLPVNSWYEYLNEATLADAIMDRLVSKAHRFELKGKSLRTKIIQKNN